MTNAQLNAQRARECKQQRRKAALSIRVDKDVKDRLSHWAELLQVNQSSLLTRALDFYFIRLREEVKGLADPQD